MTGPAERPTDSVRVLPLAEVGSEWLPNWLRVPLAPNAEEVHQLQSLTSDEQSLFNWSGDLTTYRGFRGTRPLHELVGLSFRQTVDVIAPVAGPAIPEDKDRAIYATPCQLQEAELVGETKKRAARRGESLVGKQRCKGCMTTSTLKVADLDGLSVEEAAEMVGALIAAGISFLLHSTFSHGSKAGIRMRLWLPLDAPVDGKTYQRISKVVNRLLFRDLADRTCDALHQQQGLWATQSSTQVQAFRYVHEAKVLSVTSLLSHVEPEKPALPASSKWTATRPIAALFGPAISRPTTNYVPQLVAASRFWDAETYEVWDDVMMCFVALRVWGREDELFDICLDYCQRGSAHATAKNHLQQYSPAHIFSTRDARMPPEAALGKLFRMARDGALDVLERARRHGLPKADVHVAGLYLATYHPDTFATHKALDDLAGNHHA